MSVSYSKNDFAINSASREPSDQIDKEKEDVVSGSIAPKYRGTVADRQDMITLYVRLLARHCDGSIDDNGSGKKQVLRRNFKFITMLGFGSTVICSWEVILP